MSSLTPLAEQLATSTGAALLGVEPDVHIVAETFLAIPFLVAGTERVALVQARLADPWERRLGFVSCPARGRPCR
ncbi:hypothetical protein [Geodermatophilus maliterrae]|uniref:Uncharacterized protein n=1 Tax=Geodermatophilus maliterrae TaxID=3162531 RepID=A0ABV3XCX9_9ACTN